MRFLYYDSVTHIERGRSIAGVKTFALSEEFLRGHYGKTALIPGAIMIEAMAQLLGWLVVYSHDFKLSAVMSLIENVTVTSRARPGLRAEVYGEILSTSARDSLGKAWISVNGNIVATLDRIIYSHFHKVNPEELARRFEYYSGLKMSS
ncbi:MAG: hypothetical protein ACM3ON_09505 [Chloroflexota bacterium]